MLSNFGCRSRDSPMSKENFKTTIPNLKLIQKYNSYIYMYIDREIERINYRTM